MRFDLEPDFEARRGRPDRNHVGAGIARDHGRPEGVKPFSRLREKVATKPPDEGWAQPFEFGGLPSPNPLVQAGEGTALACSYTDGERISSGASKALFYGPFLCTKNRALGCAPPAPHANTNAQRRIAPWRSRKRMLWCWARESSAFRRPCICRRAAAMWSSSIGAARRRARRAMATPASSRPRRFSLTCFRAPWARLRRPR